MSKYEIGQIVTCCVTGIEKYGIFVNLEEYYSGLIHISEISSQFVRNINDYVEIGETIKAKVLEEDVQSHHVKLSIKDINYRQRPNGCTRIKETPNGFSTLKLMLDKWIAEKETTINIHK